MIKRKLQKELIRHLKKPEITLITGPRQAGKTTLLFWLKRSLEKKGKKTVLLNLDIETNKQFFTSQADLLKKIQLEAGENKAYVFIDEIQRKENAGLFLKGLYDMNLPYKFIVTGSGSLELKEKIHESLAGRKQTFNLSTLSFEEFVNHKTNYRYEGKLTSFFALEKKRGEKLLEEYLNFGGYPRVVLSPTQIEKQRELNEIYQSFIEKDITYLLNVKKTESFNKLVKLIAAQSGQITNYSKLCSSLNLSIKTLKDYLWYLEKTFILYKVSPFFRNVKKEIVKSPVYYFYDLGLRNHSLGILGNVQNPADFSFLFQNLVLQFLKEQAQNKAVKINFWRTKAQAEVDFVLAKGQAAIPIEVKYQSFAKPKFGRSLKSFLKKYQPKKAYVVNLDLDKRIIFKNRAVHFLPYFKLFSEKII